MKKISISLLMALSVSTVWAITPEQLIGNWQCKSSDETEMTFSFANDKGLESSVNLKIPNDDGSFLLYRIGMKGTWLLKGQQVFLDARFNQVDRIHTELKSELAKQTDEWMFSELQGDVQRRKSEKSYLQVEQIKDKQMTAYVTGNESDKLSCIKSN
ncbi:hypothetical protein [Neisseria canis]|uniref:Secreted protein n=1 Tax=Neisseria canis TaxID=493 RepID=A0A1X3CY06_9NEIS|nr:hypothetical protein [Neisseria canis]OSI12446.1 hypothetical protein BWD07_05675 [Neisseria canis]VEE99090.1 Uncharacterised protein [Neisseria canis]